MLRKWHQVLVGAGGGRQGPDLRNQPMWLELFYVSTVSAATPPLASVDCVLLEDGDPNETQHA